MIDKLRVLSSFFISCASLFFGSSVQLRADEPIETGRNPRYCFHEKKHLFVLHTSDDKNGKYFAQVFDLDTGKPVSPQLKLSAPLGMPSFNQKGDYLVTPLADGGAFVWQTSKWSVFLRVSETNLVKSPPNPIKLIQEKRNQGPITSVFSPNGKYLALSSKTEEATLFETASAKPIGDRLGHTHRTKSLSFSPDSNYLLSTGSDRSAQLIKLAAGDTKSSTIQLDFVAFDSLFTPSSQHILLTGDTGTIAIVDVKTGKKDVCSQKDPIDGLSIAPSGAILAVYSLTSKTIHVYKLGPPVSAIATYLLPNEVSYVEFSGDSSSCFCCDWTGKIYKIDFRDKSVTKLREGTYGENFWVSRTYDVDVFIVGWTDPNTGSEVVSLWNCRSKQMGVESRTTK